jgi:hypothetical protein
MEDRWNYKYKIFVKFENQTRNLLNRTTTSETKITRSTLPPEWCNSRPSSTSISHLGGKSPQKRFADDPVPGFDPSSKHLKVSKLKCLHHEILGPRREIFYSFDWCLELYCYDGKSKDLHHQESVFGESVVFGVWRFFYEGGLKELSVVI